MGDFFDLRFLDIQQSVIVRRYRMKDSLICIRGKFSFQSLGKGFYFFKLGQDLRGEVCEIRRQLKKSILVVSGL